MKILRYIGIIILIFILVTLGKLIGVGIGNDLGLSNYTAILIEEKTDTSIINLVALQLDSVNKTLPIEINEELRYDSVKYERKNNSFKQYYTLININFTDSNIASFDHLHKLNGLFRNDLYDFVDESKKMTYLKNSGVKFHRIFFDIEGVEVTAISYDK